MTHYQLTPVEVQSNLTRVRHAELLILQLPTNHDGRNGWLLNFGIGEEARALRIKRNVSFVRSTQAAETC